MTGGGESPVPQRSSSLLTEAPRARAVSALVRISSVGRGDAAPRLPAPEPSEGYEGHGGGGDAASAAACRCPCLRASAAFSVSPFQRPVCSLAGGLLRTSARTDIGACLALYCTMK